MSWVTASDDKIAGPGWECWSLRLSWRTVPSRAILTTDGESNGPGHIYADGVLTPKDQLALREPQRVRLTIEPIDDDTDRADRTAALRRLREGIERMKFFSREPLPSRDELHDRP